MNMDQLVDVTVDELREVLDSVNEKTPALRLIAAIAYKHGITQSILADWFNVERKIIYNWLTRLEERDIESSVCDEHRTGRPRKLPDNQRTELEETLQHPPTEVGFDAPAWTTKLLQEFIREEFNINYSSSSCRRLTKEAGLRYQTSKKATAEADPEEREAFEQEIKQLGHIWMPT